MESFDLQDELQGIQNPESYEIAQERDLDEENVEDLLERVVESVATNSGAVADEEVFGVYCSLLKYAEKVSGPVMKQLLDSILSGLQAEVEATHRDLNDGDEHVYMAHKTPLEVYGFLLFWFLTAAEKVKLSDKDAEPAKGKRGKGAKGAAAKASKKVETKWSWIDQVKPTLALVAKVLALPLQRIWVPTPQRDTFITCITRPAIYATETEAYMKNTEIKHEVFRVLCRAVKTHGRAQAIQISIMQSLQFYEHLSEPFAELLDILQANYDYSQLGDEVLRDIAKKTFSGDNNDSKLPRSFAKFLTEYAERCPRLVFKQLDSLQDQLNSEAYPIRQALVEVLGSIIIELSNNGDVDNADPAGTAKRITSLFDVLLERVMDVSSYVRVKTFQVFAKLAVSIKPKMPKHRLAMTRAATGALDDKTATVRKAATHLLTTLLETHPYDYIDGGKLDKATLEKEYQKVCEEVAKFDDAIGKAVEINENGAEASDEGEDEDTPKKSKKKKARQEGDEDAMDVDENGGDTEPEDNDEEMSETEDGTPKKKSKKLKPRKSQLDLNALNEEQNVLAQFDVMEIDGKRKLKKYYADVNMFIDMVEAAMEVLCGLLGSKSKAEVLEVMDFFRIAHEIGFAGATNGIRKMLHLVWRKDDTQTSEEDGKELKGIKQRLLETYRILYFDPVPGEEAAKGENSRIAKNLIYQTSEASLAELTSLEEMMRIMMEDGQISDGVVAKLWTIYGSKLNLPKSQRRGSIIILGMLALAKRSILTDKVDLLLSIGLGPQGQADPTLARYTCIALQRLNGSAKKVKGSLLNKSQRIEMDNKIFRKLQSVILHPSRTKEWFGMAEQIINTVYALGEHPDVFANEVIKRLTLKAFSPRKRPESRSQSQAAPTNEDAAPDASEDVEMNEDGDPATQTQDQTQSTSSAGTGSDDIGEAFELSQLIFVVGHVAIKHIAFLELIEREWKRQKDEKQAAEKQALGNKKSKDHDELDQVAGNAEDDIGDRMSAVRETELLYGEQSLLALYGPMIVHIAGSPHLFKDPVLRATASLAFGKLLCVSSTFCDANYRILFKILQTSKDVNIRSNVIIALGDVAVSFSTIIDENSNELYKGLSDPELVVKKNTLMVLTHLILNGMIKVKGQLGEMAKCVEDPEQRISDLAKLFFTDLATKENAIYNNLPDVISHLSSGEHAVDETVFQETLKYIFTFIEKDKQAENIVEKLCQRFRLTDDPRQWRDIAFCLSLLPFKSERSVKKLIEGLQHYRDKLHEPTVFKLFSEILAKARSNKSKDKPDTELNEFEKILDEHRAQGTEDQALEKRVQGSKAAAKKRATRKASRTKKVATPPPADDDDDMYGSD